MTVRSHNADPLGSDRHSIRIPEIVRAITSCWSASSAALPSDTTLVMPVKREIFGFAVDPPTAVLTWNHQGELSETELVLSDAVLSAEGSAITYAVTVEAGSLRARRRLIIYGRGDDRQ